GIWDSVIGWFKGLWEWDPIGIDLMGWTKFWRKFGPKKKEKYLQDQKNPIHKHKDIDPRFKDLDPRHFKKDLDPRFKGMEKIRGESAGQIEEGLQEEKTAVRSKADRQRGQVGKAFPVFSQVLGSQRWAQEPEKPKSNSSPDSLKKYDCDACLEECLSLDPFFAPTTPRWKTDDSWHLASQQVLESQRIPLKLEQGWDQEPE
ncbi:MAG: hypothetical protein QF358_12865, partial [Arenicellales bacterium]|nr:hypothetical protein [Arenicellales bacterium]